MPTGTHRMFNFLDEMIMLSMAHLHRPARIVVRGHCGHATLQILSGRSVSSRQADLDPRAVQHERACNVAQAVTRGSWLLVEDLNLAPPDVLAALVPLLEGGTLHLSHRSQVIRAAPGFQFIATVTAAPGAQAPSSSRVASGGRQPSHGHPDLQWQPYSCRLRQI